MNPTNKKPWFSPKTHGWGLYPTSWRGWITVVVFFVVEVLTVEIASHMHTGWFMVRLHSHIHLFAWQGWVTIMTPILLFTLFVVYVYYRQRSILR